jgi:UDP-N-acetylmuramoylalanine--D-glutamate ligase
MLETQYKTWVGGNIGGSLLESLPQIEPSHRVVLELSSYMLDYLGQVQWSPHLALVTMVAADHLAWHGSVEAYQDAKKNIMRFQRPDDVAVLNAKDEGALSFAGVAKGRVVTYPLAESRPFDLVLPGAHNQLNAQGAFAAASMLGIEWDAAQAAIADFPGLPHRLQLVHEAGGVRFYNDSIATIPEAAVAALASFDRKTVVQIVGGYDAHAPLTELCNALTEQAKAVLCIGATGPQIAAILAESVSQTPAAVYECGDLPTAVTMARKIAAEGDIVLLSTGCKSYDQFANFEKRGERFVELVKESGNK